MEIPDTLRNRPFTTAQAEAAGVPRSVLAGRRFRNLYRGVWICADLPITDRIRVAGAALVLPADAVASHTTALRLHGVTLPPPVPLHFSTNSALRTRMPGLILHRRRGQLHPTEISGLAVTGPDRSFVDSATLLTHRDLVRVGDWLARLGVTTPETITTYAHERHLDGVRRARRAAPFVRSGVDSVAETDVRLLLRFARLPEPEVNGWVVGASGAVLARADLLYRRYWVIVEYDGWHHERDARQRQKDHLRRERLEAAGWRVIVVTVADLSDPLRIVRRVHAALVAGGYGGPSPVMSATWHRWFAAA